MLLVAHNKRLECGALRAPDGRSATRCRRRSGLALKRLPEEILKRYQKWKDIVEVSGPAGLRLIRGFRDEPLSGEWQDHRSSRLNEQYRVIYRIEREGRSLSRS